MHGCNTLVSRLETDWTRTDSSLSNVGLITILTILNKATGLDTLIMVIRFTILATQDLSFDNFLKVIKKKMFKFCKILIAIQ